MATFLDGEVDDHRVLVELDHQVLFVLDDIGNFNSNFSWRLIPRVHDLGFLFSLEVGLGDGILSQFNDDSAFDCFLLGLTNFLQELGAHKYIYIQELIRCIFI